MALAFRVLRRWNYLKTSYTFSMVLGRMWVGKNEFLYSKQIYFVLLCLKGFLPLRLQVDLLTFSSGMTPSWYCLP